jgi:hypothetical protein
VRDARAEAGARVGGRYDVRVLEPSPPAVNAPPFFADDPVSGGHVVPVERPGARTWADLCQQEGDDELAAWCADRWLVRRPPAPLPRGFAATRTSLHALAEHLLAPARHAANGKIGLRFTYHGFGTPFFGDDRQLRVEDGVLVDGDRRHALSTVGDAGAFVGVDPGAPVELYQPSTPLDPEAPLAVDPVAARALGDWFGLCASVLEQLRADAGEGDSPSRVQLWPEHFDLAVDTGPDGARANFGGSPGDAGHPEPYLYVGPWEPRGGDPYWNEPFGASLSYADLLAGADPLEFLHRGRQLLNR